MANTTGGGGWYFRRSNGSGITVTKLPGGFPVPTGPQQLQTAAKSALSMVKTIVQFLPVKGETATKSDTSIVDRWFKSAGEDYTTFERLRNPDRLSWPGPGGFCVESPSRKSLPYFEELCKAMSRVCEAYQWQGISDGSEIPNSMQRFGTALIPHIDAGLLHAVAVAGQGLLEDLDPADIDGRQLVEKLAGQDGHGSGNRDKLEATKTRDDEPPKPPAAPKGEGTPVDDEAAKAARYAALLVSVKSLANDRLVGKQCRVVELLVEAGGRKRIADVATDAGVGWDKPYKTGVDGFKKGIKLKLTKLGAAIKVVNQELRIVLAEDVPKPHRRTTKISARKVRPTKKAAPPMRRQ